jgi:hypothetical protein
MEAWIPLLIIFGLFLFFMRRGGVHSYGQTPEPAWEKLNEKS